MHTIQHTIGHANAHSYIDCYEHTSTYTNDHGLGHENQHTNPHTIWHTIESLPERLGDPLSAGVLLMACCLMDSRGEGSRGISPELGPISPLAPRFSGWLGPGTDEGDQAPRTAKSEMMQ